MNPDCRLCRLAATPLKERDEWTFFDGDVPLVRADGSLVDVWMIVTRDNILDGAADRLLCFLAQHDSPWLRERIDEITEGEAIQTYQTQRLMFGVLVGIARAEWGPDAFGTTNCSLEVTMRTCPEHGWHCHARKRT